MKSTLVNMTAVLFGITLVASAGVGAVNMITAEPIAQAEQAAKVEALKVVLPPFDQTVPEALTIDDMPITVYTATKGGQVAGYAVESMTKNGFGGAISMMVGSRPTVKWSTSTCSGRLRPLGSGRRWPTRKMCCWGASRARNSKR